MNLSVKKMILFSFSVFFGAAVYAQQAIVPITPATPLAPTQVTDDVLPIAPTRYDDAVEPPKENFTSAGQNDMWEKFERGELDQDAYVRLQDDYNAQASKDPKTRVQWAKRQAAKQKLLAKKEAAKKGKTAVAKDGKNIESKTAVAKNAKKGPTKREVASVKGKAQTKAPMKTAKAKAKPAPRKPSSVTSAKKAAKPAARKPSSASQKPVVEDDFKPVN